MKFEKLGNWLPIEGFKNEDGHYLCAYKINDHIDSLEVSYYTFLKGCWRWKGEIIRYNHKILFYMPFPRPPVIAED